jgi:anti-sigma-K factor RskA
MPGPCLTQEQADEFAIGALEPHVEAALSAHLRECKACLETVEAAQRLASTLAFSIPIRKPPRQLRQRVLTSAGISRPSPFGHAFRVARGTAGVLAAFVAIAAFTGMVIVRGQINDLRDENAQLRTQVEDALSQKVELLAMTQRLSQEEQRSYELDRAAQNDRELVIALLSPESDVAEVYSTDEASSSIGRLVWDPEQKRVWFVASRLQQLPPGKTYQIWASSSGRYQSLGTFNADGSGFAAYQAPVPQGMKSYETAVVTIEQAGGAPERTDSKSIFVADLSSFRR